MKNDLSPAANASCIKSQSFQIILQFINCMGYLLAIVYCVLCLVGCMGNVEPVKCCMSADSALTIIRDFIASGVDVAAVSFVDVEQRLDDRGANLKIFARKNMHDSRLESRAMQDSIVDVAVSHEVVLVLFDVKCGDCYLGVIIDGRSSIQSASRCDTMPFIYDASTGTTLLIVSSGVGRGGSKFNENIYKDIYIYNKSFDLYAVLCLAYPLEPSGKSLVKFLRREYNGEVFVSSEIEMPVDSIDRAPIGRMLSLVDSQYIGKNRDSTFVWWPTKEFNPFHPSSEK